MCSTNSRRPAVKKAIVFGILALSSHSPALYAATTNNGPNTIANIKSNWANDDSDNNGPDHWVYYYKFNGKMYNPFPCSNGWDAKSGDANINNLLQQAYLTGTPINFGLSSDCSVSTVQFGD
jgi:hypothetical protein